MSNGLERVAERVAMLLLDLVDVAVRRADRLLGLVIVFHRIAERTGDPAAELVPLTGVTCSSATCNFFSGGFGWSGPRRCVRRRNLDAAEIRSRSPLRSTTTCRHMSSMRY